MPSIDVDVLTLHLAHPRIAAESWRWALVCRLLPAGVYQDGPANFSDTFRAPAGRAVPGHMVLRWDGCSDEVARYSRTYQEHVITEHATLGLACVLVAHRAQQEITEVTNRGDRADYWLGKKQLLLEVSGRQVCDLEMLLREKIDQLRDNPYERDGYVCVAEYGGRTAALQYCEFH